MIVEKLGNIELRHCDCIEYMRTLEDNTFDLAIVDPPYGLPYQSTRGCGKLRNKSFNKGNISRWDIAPDAEYFKELFRVSKQQIIWGGNYFNLPPTRGIICWDKCQPWENFSQWEMAWTSFDTPASLFRFDNRTGDKIHPTQKPIELYRWLLNKYAKSGWKIFDSHLGSGSIAIACYMEGHELVGCEIDEQYFSKAVERIRNSVAQQSLF